MQEQGVVRVESTVRSTVLHYIVMASMPGSVPVEGHLT